MEPTVSIIMPVYNGQTYLSQAIESILNQTFDDFEFIIIDDGSNDGTSETINSFSDDRILYLRNEINLGVAKTLNKGLGAAKGKFIARMDADDISLPLRLEKQIGYLNAHLDIGVAGTGIQFIDEKNKIISSLQPPASHALILWGLIFGNCLTHSSVVLRRVLIEKVGDYRQDAIHAEDYDLWIKMGCITRLANLQETLVQKRLHNNTIESIFSEEQDGMRIKIIKSQLSQTLNRQVSDKEASAIARINKGQGFKSSYEVGLVIELIAMLFKNFSSQRLLTQKEKDEVCIAAMEKIWDISRHNVACNSKIALRAYYKISVLNLRLFIYFIMNKLFNKINRA